MSWSIEGERETLENERSNRIREDKVESERARTRKREEHGWTSQQERKRMSCKVKTICGRGASAHLHVVLKEEAEIGKGIRTRSGFME
ncbi:hypothetical protein K474DRAFT_1112265 [Panus rudis PR-1116 ss-1]|nr:hypothetical protein K474DRAFT_1112265 [Panus rudis PR-1116 ss-1]